MKEYYALSNACFASIQMILLFLFLSLFMWCIKLIDLHMLRHPWQPGINFTWPREMLFLMCCFIQLNLILLRIFVSVFIRGIRVWFSFSFVSFSRFGIKLMLTS